MIDTQIDKISRVGKGRQRLSDSCQNDQFGSLIWQGAIRLFNRKKLSPKTPSNGRLFDKFLTMWFFGSSKTRCFRRHRGDGFGSSKMCRLDNFLTSFLGPRFCVYTRKTLTSWNLSDWGPKPVIVTVFWPPWRPARFCVKTVLYCGHFTNFKWLKNYIQWTDLHILAWQCILSKGMGMV